MTTIDTILLNFYRLRMCVITIECNYSFCNIYIYKLLFVYKINMILPKEEEIIWMQNFL